MRLDVYLAENNLTQSRQKAQYLIRQGQVFCDGKEIAKPSFNVADGVEVRILGEQMPYVGRGGLKLAGAIEAFGVPVKDLVFADIGSSTGGFTDCLLQHGAKKVFAVDSGTDQLAQKLRMDDRVISMEKCNARSLDVDLLGEQTDGVVMDVSFISIKLLFGTVLSVLKDDGYFLSLIKPQFEAGRSALSKNGIVRDRGVRLRVLKEMKEEGEKMGLYLHRLMKSPILGGDGNTEYLGLFYKTAENSLADIMSIQNQL